MILIRATWTNKILTLSLHDALPIYRTIQRYVGLMGSDASEDVFARMAKAKALVHGSPTRRERDQAARSEEHTSELQSHSDLVCRLLLEKKKNILTHEGSQHTATSSL